jgi:hypothetical protein
MAISGHYVWAAFSFLVALAEALVLMAGLKYGQGTLRNVRRLLTGR